MKNEIDALSVRLGSDFFLTQGSGGNISYKEGDYLSVKSSGQKMSDALKKDIFLTLALDDIREEIERKNFSYKPAVISGQKGKPSIEVMFHVIFPYRIVVHLHPIDVLVTLVQKNAQSIIEHKKFDFKWGYLAYNKPGGEIARNIYQLLLKSEGVEVIFLQNHGVIVGADNIEGVEKIIRSMTTAFQSPVGKRIQLSTLGVVKEQFFLDDYEFISEKDITELVLNESLFGILKNYWALYPDLVVFLGGAPIIYEDLSLVSIAHSSNQIDSPFVFLKGVGILRSKYTKSEQDLHLRTFYEILIRLPPDARLNTLSSKQISELVTWDDELYRKNLSNNGEDD